MVERTNSWLNDFGRLRRCTERRRACVDAYCALARPSSPFMRWAGPPGSTTAGTPDHDHDACVALRAEALRAALEEVSECPKAGDLWLRLRHALRQRELVAERAEHTDSLVGSVPHRRTYLRPAPGLAPVSESIKRSLAVPGRRDAEFLHMHGEDVLEAGTEPMPAEREVQLRQHRDVAAGHLLGPELPLA